MFAFQHRFVRPLLVISACASVAACQRPPQDVPAALEDALRRHDKQAVLALVDKHSAPLVESALDSVADRTKSPYWLADKPAPIHVVRVEHGEAGLLITVEAAGVKREWALVEEGGGWKVDLAATAAHRAWDVSYREGK